MRFNYIHHNPMKHGYAAHMEDRILQAPNHPRNHPARVIPFHPPAP